MKRAVYPVVITPPETDRFYLAYAPDIDSMTQGESMSEVLEMAEDLISIHGVCLQDMGQKIPPPSVTEPPHEAGQLVSWVSVDFDAYRLAIEPPKARKETVYFKLPLRA